MFASKKILTIGAYERDNFGDLLFFIILRTYLKNYELIPGAVVAADMTKLMGEVVLPYPALIGVNNWDAVWVVGGEIGGASIEAAIVMSISKQQERIFRQTDDLTRRVTETLITFDSNRMTVGYLPSASILSKNCKLIINSVGLQSIKQVSPETQIESFATLSRADFLSVRDPVSQMVMKEGQIQSRIAPDVVHIISSIYKKPNKPEGLPSKYMLVQISEDMFAVYDKREIAKQLDSVAKKYSMSIVFFAAGTANYHDSFAIYDELNALVKANSIVYIERDPLRLAFCIANAGLWIGSSLHGRIISSAYAVSRISLNKNKVNNYAEYWDSEQPYAVDLLDIATAADKAFGSSPEELAHISKKLTRLAKENLDYIKCEVL